MRRHARRSVFLVPLVSADERLQTELWWYLEVASQRVAFSFSGFYLFKFLFLLHLWTRWCWQCHMTVLFQDTSTTMSIHCVCGQQRLLLVLICNFVSSPSAVCWKVLESFLLSCRFCGAVYWSQLVMLVTKVFFSSCRSISYGFNRSCEVVVLSKKMMRACLN